VRVGRNQLLRTFYSDSQLSLITGPRSLPDWYDSRQEITHLDGVISLGVEEIQTIPLLIDIVGIPDKSAKWSRREAKSLLVGIMLQDQLLQPQERPLVRNLLPDLHTSFPGVLRCQFRTCRTLSSVNNKGEDECLL
jgi:hypothetical protein